MVSQARIVNVATDENGERKHFFPEGAICTVLEDRFDGDFQILYGPAHDNPEFFIEQIVPAEDLEIIE